MKNKPILIGGIIGFLCAFIPWVIAINSNSEGGYLIFLLPPFTLVWFTLGFTLSIASYIHNLFSFHFSFYSTYMGLSILIWTVIGLVIGWIIQKRRSKNEK